MKPRKVIPSMEVRYLKDAAGIQAGTEKFLPVPLALSMIKAGHCEATGAKTSAEAVKPTVKEAKAKPETKELKTKPKTKSK